MENAFSATSRAESPRQPSRHPKASPTFYSLTLGQTFRLLSAGEYALLRGSSEKSCFGSESRPRGLSALQRRIGRVRGRLLGLQLRLALRWPVLEPLLVSVRYRAASDALVDRATLGAGKELRSSVFLSWVRRTKTYAKEFAAVGEKNNPNKTPSKTPHKARSPSARYVDPNSP